LLGLVSLLTQSLTDSTTPAAVYVTRCTVTMTSDDRRNLQGVRGYAYPPLLESGVPPLFGRMKEKITATFPQHTEDTLNRIQAYIL